MKGILLFVLLSSDPHFAHYMYELWLPYSKHLVPAVIITVSQGPRMHHDISHRKSKGLPSICFFLVTQQLPDNVLNEECSSIYLGPYMPICVVEH